MTDKILELPGATLTGSAIADMKRQLPEMMELSVLLAKLRMASFKAHCDAGFSAEQALELCKSLDI